MTNRERAIALVKKYQRRRDHEAGAAQAMDELQDAIEQALDDADRRATSRMDAELGDRTSTLARQYERAHVEEMKQVARMAFEAGPLAVDSLGDVAADADMMFEQWWRDHVLSPDGAGIRIR